MSIIKQIQDITKRPCSAGQPAISYDEAKESLNLFKREAIKAIISTTQLEEAIKALEELK